MSVLTSCPASTINTSLISDANCFSVIQIYCDNGSSLQSDYAMKVQRNTVVGDNYTYAFYYVNSSTLENVTRDVTENWGNFSNEGRIKIPYGSNVSDFNYTTACIDLMQNGKLSNQSVTLSTKYLLAIVVALNVVMFNLLSNY